MVERARNELVIDAYRAMDAIDAIRRWCDGQAYENDTITVAKLRGFLPSFASIRPAEAQAVAEGWKLVPVDPTEAMCVAGCREDDILGELVDWRGPDTTTREVVANLYRAMLAASPATGGA